MKYSISTCSFYKYRIRKLLQMPADFGVEIMYEFGSEDQWRSCLDILSAQGMDGFSIHAPFAFVDIAAPCDEKKLFDTLRRPFDLYHRYNGECYVLHTYGDELGDPAERRARATDRLAKFQDICKSEGVLLAAENLCGGKPALFDQEQFLQIFKDVPDLHCLIDVGHALVTGMDIGTVQRTLGDRICGYHLHNNDGKGDTHCRLQEGIMDWKSFAENYNRYTPNATGVLEYLLYTDMDVYRQDRDYLEGLLKAAAK